MPEIERLERSAARKLGRVLAACSPQAVAVVRRIAKEAHGSVRGIAVRLGFASESALWRIAYRSPKFRALLAEVSRGPGRLPKAERS